MGWRSSVDVIGGLIRLFAPPIGGVGRGHARLAGGDVSRHGEAMILLNSRLCIERREAADVNDQARGFRTADHAGEGP